MEAVGGWRLTERTTITSTDQVMECILGPLTYGSMVQMFDLQFCIAAVVPTAGMCG